MITKNKFNIFALFGIFCLSASLTMAFNFKDKTAIVQYEKNYLEKLSKLDAKTAKEEIEKTDICLGSIVFLEKFYDVLYPTELLFKYAFKYANETNKDLLNVYLDGIKFAVSRGLNLSEEKQEFIIGSSLYSFKYNFRAIDIVSKENMGKNYDPMAFEFLKTEMEKNKLNVFPIKTVGEYLDFPID